MALSDSFNEEEFSDVILHFSAAPSSEDPDIPVGSRRPRPAPSRSLFVHRVFLSGSLYFKAMLQRWEPDLTPASSSSAADGNGLPASAGEDRSMPKRRVELVHEVREGEMDAAEMLVRSLYKAPLSLEVTGNPKLLLQMLILADEYQCPTYCTEPIIAALSAMLHGPYYDASVLPMVYVNMPSEMMAVETIQPLLVTCRRSLLQHYGNLPYIITGAQRPRSIVPTAAPAQWPPTGALLAPALLPSHAFEKFCCLPHLAVLEWLKSDNLKVHSENCVVFQLTAWVHSDDHAPCCPEQLDELARHVRVCHLTPSYLHAVLPDLEWFRSCRCMAFLPMLQVAMATNRKASLVWTGPKAWLAEQRTRTYPALTKLTLDLGPNEIPNLLNQAGLPTDQAQLPVDPAAPPTDQAMPPPEVFPVSKAVYSNGVFFRLGARVWERPQGKYVLWLGLKVDAQCLATAFQPFRSSIKAVGATGTVASDAGVSSTRFDVVLPGGEGAPWTRINGEERLTDSMEEALAPFMVDVNFKVTARIH